MPEAMRPWGRIGGAALAGLALTLLLAIDAWPVALAGALAQPAFALAVSWWRGTRTSAKWPRDAASLAATRTACRKFFGLSEESVLNWRCAAVSTTGLSLLTVRPRK